MAGVFELGEKLYTLDNLTIAAYSITANTYGTSQDLTSGQTFSIQAEADNDKLMGYGVSTALLSVIRGAKIKFGAGGFDRSIMAIIANISNATSNSTPNRIVRTLFPAGGAGLPYWGAIATGPTDDGGRFAVGCQAVKLDKYPDFTLDGKTNKYNVVDTDGYAIPIAVAGTSYLMHAKTYETASGYTAPTDGASFLAFFTGF